MSDKSALIRRLIPEQLLVVLLPYVLLCFFSHPTADDLDYIHMPEKRGLAGGLHYLYFSWAGRYVANIALLLNPWRFGGMLAYHVSQFLAIVLSVLAARFLIGSVAGTAVSAHWKWIGALTITALWLHHMPAIGEEIYLWMGIAEYRIGSLLAFVFLGLAARAETGRWAGGKALHVALMSVALVLTCGFNETHILYMALAVGLLAFFAWRNRTSNRALWTILLAVLIVSAGASLLAPGNYQRAVNFPNKYQFFHSTGMAFLYTGRFIADWLFNAPLIAATFLFVPISRKLAHAPSKLPSGGVWLHPYVSLILLFLVVYIATFLPHWGTGILGQYHTANIAFWFFLPLWFLNIHCWLNASPLLQKLLPGQLALRRKWLMPLLLIGTLLFSSNGRDALTDLFRGRAFHFDRQMTARYELLETCHESPADTCYIPPVTVSPKSYFVMDVDDNPDSWINFGYEKVFGTGDIIADHSKIQTTQK